MEAQSNLSKSNLAESGSSPLHGHMVTAADRDQAVLAQICEALEGMNFGSINVVVQDGVVVQIERNEKFRPTRSGEAKDVSRSRRRQSQSS